MILIMDSFIKMAVKAVFLMVLAYAGVVCGKKYRDKKDAKKTEEL